MVKLGNQVHKVLVVLKEELEKVDLLEVLDLQVLEDKLDHKEQLVQLDPQALLDYQVRWENREMLEIQEQLVLLDSLVQEEKGALLDPLDLLVTLVQQELQDHKDLGACQEKEVILEQLGPQVQEVLLDQVASVVKVD
jgi:hypothetical protein